MEKITSLLYHYTSSDPHNSNPNPTIYLRPFLSLSLSLSPSPTRSLSLYYRFSSSLSPPLFLYHMFFLLYPSFPFRLFFFRKASSQFSSRRRLVSQFFSSVEVDIQFCSSTQLL